MTLIKIIKEKVWREEVNKAIHTSSGRDTGVRQRKITIPSCELGDFHESAPLLFSGLPAASAAGLALLSAGLGLVWRSLGISCAASQQRALMEAALTCSKLKCQRHTQSVCDRGDLAECTFRQA